MAKNSNFQYELFKFAFFTVYNNARLIVKPQSFWLKP